MNNFAEHLSSDGPKGVSSIINVAIPFLLWCLILPGIGYVIYHFIANFEFYHPLNSGPFWSP